MTTAPTTPRDRSTATDRDLVTVAQDHGHPEALATRREVVRRYQPLVLSMARRLHRTGGPAHDDVIS